MNTLCSSRLPVTALRPRRASRCFGLAVSVLAAGWLTAGHAVADTIVYTSLASQTDGFQTNGGATAANGSTTLLADDITFASGAANQIVNSFIIDTSNSSGAANSATATVEFFATNGTNGGPGTLLGSASMANSFASSITRLTFTLPGLFTIPANGQIWAGIYFTGTTGSSTQQGLNSLGVLDKEPATVGSSQANTAFLSSGPAVAGGSPMGTILTASPNGQPLNLAMQFAVPEPSSWAGALLGGVLLGWMLRRRRV